jgi:hypothetical protein
MTEETAKSVKKNCQKTERAISAICPALRHPSPVRLPLNKRQKRMLTLRSIWLKPVGLFLDGPSDLPLNFHPTALRASAGWSATQRWTAGR